MNLFEDKAFKAIKMFPVLKELNYVNEKLQEVEVKEIKIGDQLGEVYEDWKLQSHLTLLVVPIFNHAEEDGDDTIKALEKHKISKTKVMLPADISIPDAVQGEFLAYVPKKNIIIDKINIFSDKKIFELALKEFKELNIKCLDVEEILIKELEKSWKVNIDKAREKLENQIKANREAVELAKTKIVEETANFNLNSEMLKASENIGKDTSNHIRSEISQIKTMPVVKSITCSETLDVSFGDIYINALIRTGEELKDGIKVPKVEQKRVRIGPLLFKIGCGKITVENPEQVNGHEHPHANAGTICFGKAESEVYSLLGNLQLVKLVKMLYSWAISYNDAGAYYKIENFYKKHEESN